MTDPSKNMSDEVTQFDLALKALLHAAGAAEPLVQIATGRVLLRVPWRGDAADKALKELRLSWPAEIEDENFLPPLELRDRLRALLTSSGKAQTVTTQAIRRLGNATQDPALNAEQLAAIESVQAFISPAVGAGWWRGADLS